MKMAAQSQLQVAPGGAGACPSARAPAGGGRRGGGAGPGVPAPGPGPARPAAPRRPARQAAARHRPARHGTADTGHGTAEDGAVQGTSGESVTCGGFLDDRVLLDLHLEVEQGAGRLLLDALHHVAEHVVTLALVLDQRVALPASAPRYTLPH